MRLARDQRAGAPRFRARLPRQLDDAQMPTVHAVEIADRQLRSGRELSQAIQSFKNSHRVQTHCSDILRGRNITGDSHMLKQGWTIVAFFCVALLMSNFANAAIKT